MKKTYDAAKQYQCSLRTQTIIIIIISIYAALFKRPKDTFHEARHNDSDTIHYIWIIVARGLVEEVSLRRKTPQVSLKAPHHLILPHWASPKHRQLNTDGREL